MKRAAVGLMSSRGSGGGGVGSGVKRHCSLLWVGEAAVLFFFPVQTVAYIFIFVLFFPHVRNGLVCKNDELLFKKRKTPATITKKKVKKSPLKIVTIKKEKDTEEYRSTICVGSSSISPVLAR